MAQQSAEQEKNDDTVSVKNSSKKLREKRLNIRFTEAEFALIEAKANGMSLARYARAILTKGSIPRRERDFPKIDPRLLQHLHAIGKNLNQLVRYSHQQANAKRPIDTLNLALAIENMTQQLAQLKMQFQVQNGHIGLLENESNEVEKFSVSVNNFVGSSPINKDE